MITELAILPLLRPLTPKTISNLGIAKDVLDRASGFAFTYHLPHNHPDSSQNLYLFGNWGTVAAHEQFLVSKENLELLELLNEEIRIGGIEMWHIEGDVLGWRHQIKAPAFGSCKVGAENRQKFAQEMEAFECVGVFEGGWKIGEVDGDVAGVREWSGFWKDSRTQEIEEIVVGLGGTVVAERLKVLDVDV